VVAEADQEYEEVRVVVEVVGAGVAEVVVSELGMVLLNGSRLQYEGTEIGSKWQHVLEQSSYGILRCC